MKASSATSGTATTPPPPTGPSSGNRPPSRINAEGFALSGPSKLPDPAYNAYRKDLADLALAGTVIASHYAEPLARQTSGRTGLFEGTSPSAREIGKLEPGEPFLMLDDSLGWAWGYAGAERRVGYIPSACVEA